MKSLEQCRLNRKGMNRSYPYRCYTFFLKSDSRSHDVEVRVTFIARQMVFNLNCFSGIVHEFAFSKLLDKMVEDWLSLHPLEVQVGQYTISRLMLQPRLHFHCCYGNWLILHEHRHLFFQELAQSLAQSSLKCCNLIQDYCRRRQILKGIFPLLPLKLHKLRFVERLFLSQNFQMFLFVHVLRDKYIKKKPP